jgi:valyl-tRNA synthetase
MDQFDHRAIEARVRALWEERGVYRFHRAGRRPVFSIDTPPAYVSASHLHVGHAMSYSQADFVARYRRMRGERVFYPMGFDDNGLPTERYVEQKYGVRAADLPRAEFVALCLAETQETGKTYEEVWRRLGLAVDWSLRYSTIDERCRRTAQASFIKLYEAGHVRRAAEPILWCPTCRTALAQADLDERPGGVGVHERCQTPVELQTRPQWFVAITRHREALLRRAAELEWVPDHMRRRLEDWIRGLRWDWNISRQRHYGVPFPVWFCHDCGRPVCAELASLPVDPLVDLPPVAACPACGGALDPDPDVMDTWLTSSLTPQVNAGDDPQLAPMSLRVQAFEIIRTWLFYTIVQSHLHFDRLPWRTVMISGHGLNEQGRKISKRDLRATDGFNRYLPEQVIDRYGADALRLWATGARVGGDLRYHEKEVRAGRRTAVKLWNVARFAVIHDAGPGGPAIDERADVDRQLLGQLAQTVDRATEAFERYDVMHAYQAITGFFWPVYCDRYIELVKERFRDPSADQASARATIWESLRVLLGLFAPFAPFVTEEIFQRLYAGYEAPASLHQTRWPGS